MSLRVGFEDFPPHAASLPVHSQSLFVAEDGISQLPAPAARCHASLVFRDCKLIWITGYFITATEKHLTQVLCLDLNDRCSEGNKQSGCKYFDLRGKKKSTQGGSC